MYGFLYYVITRVSCKTVRLFVEVPQPGDSEVTFSVFESSCQAGDLVSPLIFLEGDQRIVSPIIIVLFLKRVIP